MPNLLSIYTSKSFFCEVAFSPIGLQPALLHGVNSSQMQDFPFAYFEILEGLPRAFSFEVLMGSSAPANLI